MTPLRIAVVALAIAAIGISASAQNNSQNSPVGQTGSMPMHHSTGGVMAHSEARPAAVPTEPGQAAFGAIQEVVETLQADPQTDWSKVNIDVLRQHLIDMDEVTLRAAAQEEPIENGLRVEVTGSDRTLAAIQRMVPDHAREIDGLHGWTVRTTPLPDGVELTATANDQAEVQKIRALGFMGIMVQGSHHQMHHLAIAKGEFTHMH